MLLQLVSFACSTVFLTRFCTDSVTRCLSGNTEGADAVWIWLSDYNHSCFLQKRTCGLVPAPTSDPLYANDNLVSQY